ncbi:MAG: histidine phosphatase family protein [Sphingomonas sp.]|uniref:SixA phosphatase family protein n=1 Tax=Sphingomonas sp. TaxID=28214 RepID=UPI0017E1A9CE|nr:histidine phosphatase family protein [Sphingomonas sp.]MBA3667284.1 histidine phosphatase family protein [Sphingomonas sp.]
MKRLILLRHAKAEADSPGGDFERPLSARGRKDALRMGEEIRRLGLNFDLVLASPARRVAETVEALGELVPRFDPRLYNASTGQLLNLVREIEDHVGSLLLVGHNPGIELLAARLAASERIGDYPTGALAETELTIDQWREAGKASGRLIRFISPKDLA